LVKEKIRRLLVEIADGHSAKWPQYRGHWDSWRVGRAAREVKTKLGVACHSGELVLFTERTEPGEQVFYSKSNRIDTIVDAGTIKELK
jgi:hypothetical protein